MTPLSRYVLETLVTLLAVVVLCVVLLSALRRVPIEPQRADGYDDCDDLMARLRGAAGSSTEPHIRNGEIRDLPRYGAGHRLQ